MTTRAPEVVAALVVAVLAEVELTLPWDDGFRVGPLWVAVLVAGLLPLPLALIRTAPGRGLAFMWAIVLVPSLLGPTTVLFLGGIVPALVMTVVAARADDGPVGRYAWAGGVLLQLSSMHVPDAWSLSDVMFGLVVFGGAWGVGRGLRRSDLQRRELAAALHALEWAGIAAEVDARRGERDRVAGEMHDLVGHAVSLMVLQLGAARSQLETQTAAVTPTDEPALARAVDCVRAGEVAGREALEALRAVMVRLGTTEAQA
jgi:signal transduction histidine kinase